MKIVVHLEIRGITLAIVERFIDILLDGLERAGAEVVAAVMEEQDE